MNYKRFRVIHMALQTRQIVSYFGGSMLWYHGEKNVWHILNNLVLMIIPCIFLCILCTLWGGKVRSVCLSVCMFNILTHLTEMSNIWHGRSTLEVVHYNPYFIKIIISNFKTSHEYQQLWHETCFNMMFIYYFWLVQSTKDVICNRWTSWSMGDGGCKITKNASGNFVYSNSIQLSPWLVGFRSNNNLNIWLQSMYIFHYQRNKTSWVSS